MGEIAIEREDSGFLSCLMIFSLVRNTENVKMHMIYINWVFVSLDENFKYQS